MGIFMHLDQSKPLNDNENIDIYFKNYTDNLAIRLNEIQKICLNIENQLLDKLDETEIYIHSEFENIRTILFNFLDQHLLDLKMLTQNYNSVQHKNSGAYFRKIILPFLNQSPFWTRVFHKPRGYAGDSEMMQMIYKNKFDGLTLFGKLLHKHGIERPAAQAVRNRRKLIPSLIKNLSFVADIEHSGLQSKEFQENTIRILSVACGPAWEMRDLISEIKNHGKYEFYFLDQDQEALIEAKKGIEELEALFSNLKINANYLHGSVRRLIEDDDFVEKIGKFDFIYSMGLFDYLPDIIASKLINRLSLILKSKGELVIGNYHASNPDIPYMEYWGDWKLLHRSEQDLLKIAVQNDLYFVELNQAKSIIGNNEIISTSEESIFSLPQISFDDSGTQMFLHMKRA
jgi:extracellular factor (EF) 3-hydroxypalmitic acid methyl ester biosynthesis protein